LAAVLADFFTGAFLVAAAFLGLGFAAGTAGAAEEEGTAVEVIGILD